MLGLAATISHTAVVWLIAFGGISDQQALLLNQQNRGSADFRSDHYWHRVLDVLAYWRGERNWLENMHEV